MKPLERDVESSKEVNTQLRAHIETLRRKEKLIERELKAAEEQVREYVRLRDLLSATTAQKCKCVVLVYSMCEVFPINKSEFFCQKIN